MKKFLLLWILFPWICPAQDIVKTEYFFDTDPGVGNATAVFLLTPSTIANINLIVPTAGLSAGNHVLYVRTQDNVGKWSLSEGRVITIVSSIIQAEYFYDTDPGVGNGIAISPGPSSDSVNFTAAIPSTGLTAGTHWLYIRTKDSNGKWSLSEARSIEVVPALARAEYFYDTDPGVGNGIIISPFPLDDSVNVTYNIPTTGLLTGIHNLYIRTRDSQGRWSLNEARTFNIVPAVRTAEYFYDTDPGVGNATPISSFSADDSVNLVVNLPTNSLSAGTHNLYIRTKDSDGRWSLSEARSFTIIPSIVKAEYFFDTDPGVGNGTDLGFVAIDDSINSTYNVPTAGLINGPHTLYIRTKDNNGKWSLSEARSISIEPAITAAEYFYDTDPGVGNGNPIAATLSDDSVNFDYLVPTTGISPGSHMLYIRTKDSNGRWSLSEGRSITTQNDAAILTRFFIEGYYIGSGQLVSAIDPVNHPEISDAVTISLIDPAPPYNSFYSQNTHVMTDGTATINLPAGASGNSYYVVVKHRNAIETWSAAPVVINPALTSYSFTGSAAQAYGNNMTETFDNQGWSFYSGDIADANLGLGFQDGIIEATDYLEMENAINVVLVGYNVQDITGDYVVEATDYTIMENNVNRVIFSHRP